MTIASLESEIREQEEILSLIQSQIDWRQELKTSIVARIRELNNKADEAAVKQDA
jgi:hypothetical protein